MIIVPELNADTVFALDASRLVSQIRESVASNVTAKPVLVGPITYLALGKAKDNSSKLALLPHLLTVYADLLDTLAAEGASWVQVDEHGRRRDHY